MAEEKKTVPKKLTKHNKDLPRYPVVLSYEKEFKRNYSNALGVGLDLLIARANKMVKK